MAIFPTKLQTGQHCLLLR